MGSYRGIYQGLKNLKGSRIWDYKGMGILTLGIIGFLNPSEPSLGAKMTCFWGFDERGMTKKGSILGSFRGGSIPDQVPLLGVMRMGVSRV